MEKLLNIREISEILGVSIEHLRRLRKAGRMPEPLQLGRSLRWAQAVIENWIEDGCPSNAPKQQRKEGQME